MSKLDLLITFGVGWCWGALTIWGVWKQRTRAERIIEKHVSLCNRLAKERQQHGDSTL